MGSVAESYRGNRVRVFRLDHDRLVAALRERAERLVDERGDVLEVRLFGSLASGRAKPGSDADIWIRVAAATAPFVDRGATFAPWFAKLGIGCEIVVHTEEEWRSLENERRRFVGMIAAEGLLLARR